VSIVSYRSRSLTSVALKACSDVASSASSSTSAVDILRKQLLSPEYRVDTLRRKLLEGDRQSLPKRLLSTLLGLQSKL